MERDRLERLRQLVRGVAGCPSCGVEDVPPDEDLCPHCEEEVVVEPLSPEFLEGPAFADRQTLRALLDYIDELEHAK